MFYPIDTLGGYRARLDSHTIHELVRFDPGVKLVEHDSYGKGVYGLDAGESFKYTPPAPEISKRWAKNVHIGSGWWNVMISAGKKLTTPVPKTGDYVSSLYFFSTRLTNHC
jgi:hypothetical protein